MKYVLFYESAPDVLEKAPLHQADHGRYMREVQADGELLMTGPFGNPVDEGAMSIFTSRAAAEECAKSDPFVLNGVVARSCGIGTRGWIRGFASAWSPGRSRAWAGEGGVAQPGGMSCPDLWGLWAQKSGRCSEIRGAGGFPIPFPSRLDA